MERFVNRGKRKLKGRENPIKATQARRVSRCEGLILDQRTYLDYDKMRKKIEVFYKWSNDEKP